MKEDFLQMLWQNQYLNRQIPWHSSEGLVQVEKPGFRNRKQAGPDFDQAKIKLDAMEWVGAVEIHVRSDEWEKHGHHLDPAYNSVILHVVWEDNQPCYRQDGTLVPVLELKELVSFQTILKYRQILANQNKTKPCQSFLRQCPQIAIISMQERVLVERLERKVDEILVMWHSNQMNWLETLYQAIAQNLGLKANKENMAVLARSIPLQKLVRHQPIETGDSLLPGLFLGMAGFLQPDDHLYQDFVFLKHKFGLEVPEIIWHRFGIRAPARPELRVLLLALLVPHVSDWFNSLENQENPQEIWENIAIISPEIMAAGWSKFIQESIIINTLAPFMAALGKHLGRIDLIEKGMQWLNCIKPEKNHITKIWEQGGIKAENASQSQALIEWHTQYCEKFRCMDCAVAISFLRPAQEIAQDKLAKTG